MKPADFKSELRQLAGRYAEAHGAPSHADRFTSDFLAEVEAAWNAYMVRVRVAEQGEAKLSRVERGRKIAAACRVLRMDPPPRGKPADLKLASRQKRVLVRLYHPDTNEGSDEHCGALEDVLAAYETLRQLSNVPNNNVKEGS